MAGAVGDRRTRRRLLGQGLAAATAFALASCGVAQPEPPGPKRLPRVGFIDGPAFADGVKAILAAFQAGLHDHGYVDGQTVQLEIRMWEGRPGQWDEFARELASIPVDVIVSGTTPGWTAAVRATKSVPIVLQTFQDPVALGLVQSLARPGGNVTGIAVPLAATGGKRLELLRELVPSIGRVGVIWDGATPAGGEGLRGAREVASGLGIEVIELVIPSGQHDLPAALDLATRSRVEAILVGGVPFHIGERRREIAAYALDRRIPLASEGADFAEAGGLLAFGSDNLASRRRMAYFVDRILRGTKPGDLPIEEPATFETIFNLKTARSLGVVVPQSILARATKVIQ